MSRHISLRAALAVAAVVLAAAPAVADLVIFKDGFAVQGKVKRQTTNFIDPASGRQMEVAKLGGFFMVDDDARRIVFSFHQVADVDEKDPAKGAAEQVKFFRALKRLDNFRLPGLAQFAGVSDWDAKGERLFYLQGPDGKFSIPQRLTVISPSYVRVDALKYFWTSFYMTRELDPGLVRKLIYQHPDLKLTGTSADAAKRFKVVRFFLQAGWYDQAESELNDIDKQMPDEKERVDALRDNLKRLRAGQLFDDLERAHKAGQYKWVHEQLAKFPQAAVDEKLLTRLATLRTQMETAEANVSHARRLLAALAAGEGEGPDHKALAEAAGAILDGLNSDTVSRLEAFVSLAQQAERDRQQNRTPQESPDQLLALAVSGWLLGSGAAEAKVETGVRLWQARQFVLNYQKNHDPIGRQKLAYNYQKTGGLAFDELAQLIRTLPPPEPFATAGVGIGQWDVPTTYWLSAVRPAWGQWPFLFDFAPVRWPAAGRTPSLARLTTDLPWGRRKGVNYLVQLPPEYHPGRSYPVLFVLHQAGQKPLDMLGRWSTLAAQNGYILVAPEWVQGLREAYDYSADEHAAVTDVLRDLRRRFQVDSDRVFLFGWGDGGNMAYDVGLSHPDLFAGVIPMGARPRYFARVYWRNGQYLPFYVIDGDVDGESPSDNRRLFQQWVPRGYPSLYVEYKGRGMEWFGGELPFVFDWMSRKKRAAAVPELGKGGTGGVFGEEFQSLRPTDDRFYWLAGEGLSEKHVNEAGSWKSGVSAATVQGRISEGNHINVNIHGFKRATVWLGPGMVDYTKPVTVNVNMARSPARAVTPSLTTLLEDFYLRGDRQRLFWARLDFNL